MEEQQLGEQPVAQIITLEDLQSEHDVLVQKEAAFASFLLSNVVNVDVSVLRPTLIQWAAQGYPASYRILPIQIDLPELCSDGVRRDVYQYLTFCTGMTFDAILNAVQQKFVGIVVDYITEGTTITLLVSKA